MHLIVFDYEAINQSFPIFKPINGIELPIYLSIPFKKHITTKFKIAKSLVSIILGSTHYAHCTMYTPKVYLVDIMFC